MAKKKPVVRFPSVYEKGGQVVKKTQSKIKRK